MSSCLLAKITWQRTPLCCVSGLLDFDPGLSSRTVQGLLKISSNLVAQPRGNKQHLESLFSLCGNGRQKKEKWQASRLIREEGKTPKPICTKTKDIQVDLNALLTTHRIIKVKSWKAFRTLIVDYVAIGRRWHQLTLMATYCTVLTYSGFCPGLVIKVVARVWGENCWSIYASIWAILRWNFTRKTLNDFSMTKTCNALNHYKSCTCWFNCIMESLSSSCHLGISYRK